MTKKTLVSLFCGAGGLDIGFEQAGFQTVWANDFNKDACATFSKWNPTATVAVGDLATASFDCVVSVAQSNCPCNCTSAPTTVQLLNSSDVGSTGAHYNMLITKLC